MHLAQQKIQLYFLYIMVLALWVSVYGGCVQKHYLASNVTSYTRRQDF